MTLKNFINNYGASKLAKTLEVEASTVRQWRRERGLPRPALCVKINQLSKGRVTYRELIETAAKFQTK